MGAVGLNLYLRYPTRLIKYSSISNGIVYFYCLSSAATVAWFYSIIFPQARGQAGPVNDKSNCREG
jgi:hypothetical protein